MEMTITPVLTEPQWERVLTHENIPELDPEATAGLILHKLGWFTWGDVKEHRRVGDLMGEGIKNFSAQLAEMGSVKMDPQEYFQRQQQLTNLKNYQAWNYDMATRIAALLPPPELLERLELERAKAEAGVYEPPEERKAT